MKAPGTARHGTHVAGLMVYDRPDFGIIPYRILPYYENRQDKIDANVGKSDRFINNFAEAVADADKKGVRIVNLSLGGSFMRPDSDNTVNDEALLEKFENLSKIVTGALSQIIKKYPHILFVAAAGNDSGWSDNKSRVQYPCGVEADNILCVGALNTRDAFTTFTNIPMNNIDLVFAPGSKVKSLAPSDRCPFIDDLIESFLKENSGAALCSYKGAQEGWKVDAGAQDAKAPIIRAAYDACAYKANQYTRMSGTSMATPIVAHLAAEILVEKDIPLAKDLISEIKSRAQVDQGKSFVSYSLTASRLKVPSWNLDPAKAINVPLADNGQMNKEVAAVYKYLGLPAPANAASAPFQIIMGKEVK
jgi:subtilisin family serine protease